MVASPHSPASAAGLLILRKGGSAVDAAIAAAAVLGTVYPHMTGIGGDRFWLVHDPRSGRTQGLSTSGPAARVGQDWSEAMGHALANRIHRDAGMLEGGADPRGDGAAVG